MKQMTHLTPEYDIGDEVAFLEGQRVVKGVIKNITQSLGDKPSLFYQIATAIATIVKEESALLFAEVSYAKPLFAAGMIVRDAYGTEGLIIGTTIDLDIDGYTVLYTLETGDTMDEDDIVEVERDV
jgi:hypothetical protein